MRRLLAVAISVLVALVAAWLLTSTFSRSRPDIRKPLVRVAGNTENPIVLKQRADCMYKALAGIPGVHQPRLGSVTSDGWTRPFVAFQATTREGLANPMVFEAERYGNEQNGYWYWFLESFSGPPPPGTDARQMQLILDTWRERCLVAAVIEVN